VSRHAHTSRGRVLAGALLALVSSCEPAEDSTPDAPGPAVSEGAPGSATSNPSLAEAERHAQVSLLLSRSMQPWDWRVREWHEVEAYAPSPPADVPPLPADAQARLLDEALADAEAAGLHPSWQERYADGLVAIARARRALGTPSLTELRRTLDAVAEPPAPSTKLGDAELAFGLVEGGAFVGNDAVSCSFHWESLGDRVVTMQARCRALQGPDTGPLVERLQRELGPGFEAGKYQALDASFTHPAALAAADSERARVLGNMEPVDVPPELERPYRLLTDRRTPLAFGSGCGLGGADAPGLVAARMLVAAHRTDLLGNVLRGPSAGGRVYGALALIALAPVAPGDADAIAALRENDRQKIGVCNGCFAGVARMPAELVPPPARTSPLYGNDPPSGVTAFSPARVGLIGALPTQTLAAAALARSLLPGWLTAPGEEARAGLGSPVDAPEP
jgi:hypothetical protein